MFNNMTPAKLNKLITVSLIMLTLIVITGAAVRLTQSGLGCEDWPGCTSDKPLPEWELHGVTEFGNRLLSALVGVAAIVAAYAARARLPNNTAVRRLGWFVTFGVAFQAILGAITVFMDLHPITVAAHFLISMVLITAAVYMKQINQPSTKLTSADLQRAPSILLGLLAVVLVLGTLVTGTGPNSGDVRASRLSFDLESIARIHAVSVWIFLAFLVYVFYKYKSDSTIARQITVIGVLSIVQGGVGYLQYHLGVPPWLVLLHVIGATLLWLYMSYFHAFHSLKAMRQPETVSEITNCWNTPT